MTTNEALFCIGYTLSVSLRCAVVAVGSSLGSYPRGRRFESFPRNNRKVGVLTLRNHITPRIIEKGNVSRPIKVIGKDDQAAIFYADGRGPPRVGGRHRMTTNTSHVWDSASPKQVGAIEAGSNSSRGKGKFQRSSLQCESPQSNGGFLFTYYSKAAMFQPSYLFHRTSMPHSQVPNYPTE